MFVTALLFTGKCNFNHKVFVVGGTYSECGTVTPHVEGSVGVEALGDTARSGNVACRPKKKKMDT